MEPIFWDDLGSLSVLLVLSMVRQYPDFVIVVILVFQIFRFEKSRFVLGIVLIYCIFYDCFVLFLTEPFPLLTKNPFFKGTKREKS